ncbi:MAG: hypothetical protein CMF41_02350 [Legionellales bacterium]|nr:hypothetical protein [Legionellales bacterium]
MHRLLLLIIFIPITAFAAIPNATSFAEPISQLSIININNHVNQITESLESIKNDNILLKQRLDSTIRARTPVPATPQELSYLVGLAGMIFVLAVAGSIEKNTPKHTNKTVYRKRTRSLPVENTKTIEQESEYDFMSSSEAIPAKFNLIEAYLSMSNYDLALKELKTILKVGDIHQQNRAKMILNQIPTTG